jgi:hypothetical protein
VFIAGVQDAGGAGLSSRPRRARQGGLAEPGGGLGYLIVTEFLFGNGKK